MTFPFELVLHHRYTLGNLRDRSGYGNHGYGDLAPAAGRHGPADAVAFDGATSRIFVPPSPTLLRPGGFHTSITVLVAELGHRRTLIEGYLAFAVGVEVDGALGGSILGPYGWSGVQSRSQLVPLGEWITVTFTYIDDGTMTLTMNGAPVAEGYRRLGQARGVNWPFGLNIGAWPDGDQRMLKGSVEEVMLWRAPLDGA